MLTTTESLWYVIIMFYPYDEPTFCQTDEQAPLPAALSQMVQRVKDSLSKGSDFVFNCQMGRGRTTTGMVTACLIATVTYWDDLQTSDTPPEDAVEETYDSMDGPSEEETYLQGESTVRVNVMC